MHLQNVLFLSIVSVFVVVARLRWLFTWWTVRRTGTLPRWIEVEVSVGRFEVRVLLLRPAHVPRKGERSRMSRSAVAIYIYIVIITL